MPEDAEIATLTFPTDTAVPTWRSFPMGRAAVGYAWRPFPTPFGTRAAP
jgi:hypothetical protein